MKKTWLTIVFLISCFFSPLSANTAHYFLISELGTSAEMIALGNIEGFSNSSNSLFENVAGLYRVQRYSASFFTSEIISEVNYTNLSLAYNTGKGVIAAGYMSQTIADIIHTDWDNAVNWPIEKSRFSSNRHIIKLGYEYSLSHDLHLGVAISQHQNKLHTTTGKGLGLDLGGIYKYKKWTFSGQVKNLSKENIQYSQSDDTTYNQIEKLPREMILGVQYRLKNLRLMTQYRLIEDQTLNAIGIRYTPPYLDFINLVAGIKDQIYLRKVKQTKTMGLLLNLYGFHIAYSFQKSDHFEFDNNTYLSIYLNI